jgi:hypothetical protein
LGADKTRAGLEMVQDRLILPLLTSWRKMKRRKTNPRRASTPTIT